MGMDKITREETSVTQPPTTPPPTQIGQWSAVSLIADLIQRVGFPVAAATVLLAWLMLTGDAKLSKIADGIGSVVTAVEKNTEAVTRFSVSVQENTAAVRSALYAPPRAIGGGNGG